MSKILIGDVKTKAEGIWDRIIGTLAPTISSALEKPGLQHIDCPMHGGKDDFRVFRDVAVSGGGVCTCGTWPDGFGLIGAVNNWSFKETLSEVAGLILGATPQLPPASAVPVRRIDTAKEDRAIRRFLNSLWGSCVPLNSPSAEPARLYFFGRGLPSDIQSVRFHPALSHFNMGVFSGHHPALVALVETPDRLPVCLHRTYLTADGKKAQVKKPKKLTYHASDRPLQGAAIRLYPVKHELAIAEGIETAMAVTQLTGIPCWASVTAGLMSQFIPPAGIEKVHVFADKDTPSKYHPKGHGQEAARDLAERLWKMGIRAGVKIPPFEIPNGEKGIDWLDCFNQKHVA